MSTNEGEHLSCLQIDLQQKFNQLQFELKSNELMVKTTQENLNNSLKRSILLEHELETERLNKSMMKLKLDSFITTMNKCDNKNNNDDSKCDVNVILQNHVHLTNKMNEIQVENIELKKELIKSNSQISSLMLNQSIFLEKLNSKTLMVNSLRQEIDKMLLESQTLIRIVCASKILARKMLAALEYSKKLNNTQFDHIQHLIKEVATIKSKIHMYIDLSNENQPNMKNDQKGIDFSKTHPRLEICKQLIEILETENKVLYNRIHQMSAKNDEQKLEADSDNHI